jgi:hypothetical protein
MTVDQLIVESLKRVVRLKNENDELNKANLKDLQTRLIYPRYGIHRNHEIRISEQEIKQIFIEILNETRLNHCFLYSVEAPTEKKYVFGNDQECANCPFGHPPNPGGACTLAVINNNAEGGVSARTDVCLYENIKNNIIRKMLIEFKYSNGVNRNFCKDLFKLAHELNNNNESYFVLILDTFRDVTKNSIFGGGEKYGKLRKSLNLIRNILNNGNIKVYILILENHVNKNRENLPTIGYYRFELGGELDIVYNNIPYVEIN